MTAQALGRGFAAAVVSSVLLLVGQTSRQVHDAPAAAERVAIQEASEPLPRRRLVTQTAMRSAVRFAATRGSLVGFAVHEQDGGTRGWRASAVFYSASVSKAMLLVARLRQEPAPSAAEIATLEAMVTESDNDAADSVLGWVGLEGLEEVARAAGMRAFDANGYWANALVTPADQARLFAHIEQLVPRDRRALLRRLLSSVVKSQRWGIAAVAERHRGARVFFKGGWREGMTHQAALVEWRGRRVAIAVMTSGGPSMDYDVETIEGIAGRLLSRPA